jgi:hypothetical protein
MNETQTCERAPIQAREASPSFLIGELAAIHHPACGANSSWRAM